MLLRRMHPSSFLSRSSLTRVLRSLLEAECRKLRGQDTFVANAWSESMSLGSSGLGCDSLDLWRLAAAANEMFHLYEAGLENDLPTARTFGAWLDVIERSWSEGFQHVTFATSGSTGRPKRCSHSRAFLETEVEALVERWRDRRRIVAVVPAHHIYGFLFTAMLPDALEVPCVEAEHLGIGELRATLRPGDLVVSFPERWAYLDRSLPAWPEDVEGVVSTAPCPAANLSSLAERGLSRMTEVYGSSETAGISWRDAPGACYRLMPQWQFDQPYDAAVPTMVHRDGSRHVLMDRVTRVDDRGLALDGRRDGMVQVGGVNVAPDAVAQRLRERPGVRWAVVRLMRPEEGMRLKALLGIDPNGDAAAIKVEVERWVSAHLTSPERPVKIALSPSEVQPAKNVDW